MRLLAIASLAASSISLAHAQPPPVYNTLYTFEAMDDGPSAGIVAVDGALYGATLETVFKVSPASGGSGWVETRLQDVQRSTGIAFGANGEMYGMTLDGGASQACPLGCGTVFALTPPAEPGGPWTKHLLYTFTGDGDGAAPTGAPLIAPDGTIYGTTQYGGAEGDCSGSQPGCGTVFALKPPASPGDPWTETVLYKFLGHNDGANPGGGLVIDADGDLYGTTPGGGQYLQGAVFQLTPPSGAGGAWAKTIIYSFSGTNGDGSQPSSGLVGGSRGGLYGTTALGGIADGGTVFGLYQPTPGAWVERVLYRFEVQGGLLPVPNGNLAIGKNGALFGTTASGGIAGPSCRYGCGQIYELYQSFPGGSFEEQVLYNFQGSADGAVPLPGLVIGEDGALYGATRYGGDTTCRAPVGCGTAFQLLP